MRACRTLLELPLSHGGLGLRPLKSVRQAAYVGSWLQCAHSVAKALGSVAPAVSAWATPNLASQHQVHDAVASLAADYGLDALGLCECSWNEVADKERPRQQRTLSRAIGDVLRTRWEAGATPRELQTALSASTRDHRAGAGDWLTAVPLDEDLTVPHAVYQFAVRLRLGLPLAEVGDPCKVYKQTTHRACGCPLTAFADHAPGCALSARNARHNSLRDWWAKLVQEAGGRALTEQWVVEYAPHLARRADVRASCGPGLPTVYYDVVVAHPFATGVPTGPVSSLLGRLPDADAALRPAEQRKRADYAPPVDPATGARLQPVSMAPLAFDTYGRWGPAAADALRRWARRRLNRPDAIRSVRRKGLYQQVLARWRVARACALQRGNFATYAAAIGCGSANPDPDDDGMAGPGHFARYLTDRATATFD